VVLKNDEAIVDLGGGSVTLSADLLKHLREQYVDPAISGIWSLSDCFIVLHDHESAGELLRYDMDTNEAVWTQRVWGWERPIGSTTGIQPSHRIEVVLSEDAVYVFGASEDVLYIEKFDMNDGRNIFRFSSAF
jgi:hypothetical protein